MRIREDFRLTEDGDVVLYADIEYDSDGNLLRSTTHAVDSDYDYQDGEYQEYAYDENGLLSVCRYYNGDDTPDSSLSYTYNEDGTIASITTYDGDGGLSAVTTPEYTTISMCWQTEIIPL